MKRNSVEEIFGILREEVETLTLFCLVHRAARPLAFLKCLELSQKLPEIGLDLLRAIFTRSDEGERGVARVLTTEENPVQFGSMALEVVVTQTTGGAPRKVGCEMMWSNPLEMFLHFLTQKP